MIRVRLVGFVLVGLVAAGLGCSRDAKSASAPQVVLETNKGAIVVQLHADKAPISTKNFLEYVDAGFYDGTVFHRVIPGFMIQGGGFDAKLQKKDVRPPITNEATNGLKNKRGTLALARTGDPNSATSQFFINLVDNGFLDNRGTTPQQMGYAVFGEVVSGMDVVDEIAKVQTQCPSKPPGGPCTAPLPPGMRDVPATPVVIQKARRK